MSSEQVELVPDDAAMWRFVMWWFQGCRQGVIELGWSLPEARAIRHFRRFELEDEALWRFAVEQNRRQSNVYIRVGTIDPDAPLGRTTDEHVRDIPGIQADLDTLEQLASARRVVPILRPLGLVHTGKIPHERMQLYWLFDEPIGDGERARGLNMRLARLLGSDGSVVNPSRLMRLPGGVAWPVKPGRVAELTSFMVPDDGRPRTYPLDHVERQLPVSGPLQDEWGGPVGGQASAGPSGSSLHLSPTATVIEEIRAGRYWHNNVVKLVASWVGRGWSNAEIMLASDGLTLAGWTVEQTREEVGKAIGGARRKWGVEEPGANQSVGAFGASGEYPASDVSWDAMLSIAPREWIYGHFLIRGFVSVLAAPGGTGKTAYAVAVALAIALNKSLLGEPVHQSGKVWLCNLEDPKDEVLRRLKAAMLHFQVGREIEGLLFVDSGRDREMTIATLDNGTVIVTPLVEMLIAEIKRREITVLIVDPFIRSHRVLENANEHIDMVMTLWARVAQEAHCCVWLLHHFRKGGSPGEAASFRGATALIDAARAAVALTRMSEDEADKLGIQDEQRWRYVRLDNAKLNLAPPPDTALWLKLIGIDLGNETEELPADNVQTVERWTPASAWEGMPWSMIIRILETIEAGPEPGEYFSASPRANERWAGKVIVDDAARTQSQAKEIIRSWIESKVLVEGEYKSAAQKNHVTGCVRVDNAKLQDMRRQAMGKPDVWDE